MIAWFCAMVLLLAGQRIPESLYCPPFLSGRATPSTEWISRQSPLTRGDQIQTWISIRPATGFRSARL